MNGDEVTMPDLATLWRQALSRPMHSPACGCAVPSSIRLEPRDIELDLLDYVEDKHDLRRYPGWVNALASRAESHTTSFPVWLAFLHGQQLLPSALWDSVVTDIAGSLDSMTSHAANRLVPSGALEKGWLTGKA
ncbi:MAG: hypothetical protein V4614_17760 [Pseudomonadota bacterium]